MSEARRDPDFARFREKHGLPEEPAPREFEPVVVAGGSKKGSLQPPLTIPQDESLAGRKGGRDFEVYPGAAWYDELRPSERVVVNFLYKACDRRTFAARRSLEQIAEGSGLSVNGVKWVLKGLEERRVLAVQRLPGQKSTYWLRAIEKLRQKARRSK